MSQYPPCWQAEALLSSITALPKDCRIEITGLSFDSRDTRPGDLFIAHAGPIAQRPDFIQQAILNGAVVVLRDSQADFPDIEQFQKTQPVVPILAIDRLQERVGEIAAKFYNYPSASMQMIGITGTNGKTSCSHFIARGLQQAEISCGIIGTLGSGFPDHLNADNMTTPDPTVLQRLLAEFKQKSAQAVAMEVSSHSLAQHRVAGIQFDIAVFTNLTRDHLDYHGSMENYGSAKEQLFLLPGLNYAVINADDPFGRSLLEKYSQQLSCYAFSAENNSAYPNLIHAQDIKFSSQGFTAKVITPWGQGILKSALLGRFNLSNLLAALTVLGIMQIPLTDSLHYLSLLPTVPGRMQALGGGSKLPLVVVDYAHTPDALEKALKALREHCHGQLWCVFGCGGNRDPGKREMMGQIAERYSDQLIITDDNPRFEDPKVITNNISKGLLCPWASEVEHDRRAAIAHAIECAGANDVVLIAGKGHETYQQIGAEKIPFNDAQIAEQQLRLKAVV